MINIIDAGIVMNTSLLPEIKGDVVIPESVFNEIKSQQAKHILEMMQGENKLSVIQPLSKHIQEIEKIAKVMGQNKLSSQDIEVLATVVMMREQLNGDTTQLTLYSDDYGVRNIAHELQITSKGITTKGGNQRRRYKYRCTACGHIYKQVMEDCDICGHTKFERLRR